MIFHALFQCLDVSGWLLLSLAALLLTDVVRNWRPATFPPGPSALPVLGNLFTGVDYKAMDNLAKEYGPVFSLRRGSERMVFISGYRMVKEALVNQLDSFVDRPVVPLFDGIFKGIGVVLSNGYPWKKHRKFTVTHLRYFGEGQRSLENYIKVECSFLCEAQCWFKSGRTARTVLPGKRACLGEQLARMELFLFFTALLQRFTFVAVPDEMPSLEGVQGFTQSPEEFRTIAVPR